ncbi:unnamed protein product [Chilo suppressalis]|uniref:C2H2-type domain-containing protein n=1 Tax=Chilo suppressalis TaxID=168631 RepID=A0ABN8AT27_CHISP|nr:unnamed protein product [Chilo suppressalis]
MNPQVCVNCHNKKPVNHTDNRLVTENCGHTKCMDCLLHEKSGCGACILEKEESVYANKELSNGDSESEKSNELVVYEKDSNDSQVDNESSEKKKKLEVSHIKTESDDNGKYYVCTLCKKKFHAKSQVAYHAYCNGQRKPFQCPECNKSFATHSHFKYHMRVHRNERTYACEECGDSFFQMSKLQRHKLKHTNEKKFVCVQCNKPFSSLSSMRKHELTHTEVRPFACAICGRCFRDSSNYRKHVAKHDDKKCSCGGVCSRCTRGGGNTGPGARAHQCPRCSRAFHSRKDMRRHAAVHTDSKPFRCKICSRRFRRKDNLERHIRNTHPDYVPASAVDCDLLALKQISNTHDRESKSPEQNTDKTLLKKLNPLPPLPQEVIQKHISQEGNENIELKHSKKEDAKLIDKSYILEANNARQSVIVGNCPTLEKKIASPQGNEYVHKIRKANTMASQKNIPLPPIDEKKMIELEQKTSLNNLDLGEPPKDVELYKKILYGKSKIDVDNAHDEERKAEQTSPEMHWRRKMKLNINCSTAARAARAHFRMSRITRPLTRPAMMMKYLSNSWPTL